jgi:hypothetical protein
VLVATDTSYTHGTWGHGIRDTRRAERRAHLLALIQPGRSSSCSLALDPFMLGGQRSFTRRELHRHRNLDARRASQPTQQR